MTGTIRRAKLIRSDLANWDGRSTSYSRIDATGGTVSGRVIGDVVDVLQVYGSGTDLTRASIAAAIQQIDSNSVTLSFSPGTWTIASTLTIPSNFTCKIPAGCVFSVSSGQTLTFAGPIHAESSSFYTGSGSTVLSVDSFVGGKPWIARTSTETSAGVTPTNYAKEPGEILRHGTNTTPGTTDMRTAFFNANAGSASLYVESGNYRIASNLTISKAITFESGAILVPDAGVTITINAPITAGPYQIFNTAAANSLIRGTMPGDVLVNWWGAVDDNSSDNGDELRAAAATVAARAAGANGLGGWACSQVPLHCDGRLSIQWNAVLLRLKYHLGFWLCWRDASKDR